MPAYKCKCGHWISYGETPCKDEWVFMSDEDFDKLPAGTPAEEIYKETKSFLLCPSCRRLWIFWSGFQKEPEEYVSFGKTLEST